MALKGPPTGAASDPVVASTRSPTPPSSAVPALAATAPAHAASVAMAGPADGALEDAIGAWEREKKGSKPVPKNRELLPPIPHMINGGHKGSLRGPQTPGKGGFSAPKGGVRPKPPPFSAENPPFSAENPTENPPFPGRGGVFRGVILSRGKSQKPPKRCQMGLWRPPNTIMMGFGGIGSLKPKTENPPGGFPV